jgi:hypothetical protein
MQALTIFVEYNSGVLLRPIVHILGEVYKLNRATRDILKVNIKFVTHQFKKFLKL